MRIEFISQDDPLYILPFFEEFLRHYADEFQILRVSCSPAMGKRSRMKLLKELSLLYGALGVARLISASVTSKLLAKLPRRRGAGNYHGIQQLCAAYNIEYRLIGNPNVTEFLTGLEGRKPDILISVACPFILKKKVLSIPPMGCINIHHAPLPRYKGMMPTFWQMYHDEKSLGVTVHFMDEKLDEGAAIIQDTLPVRNGESLHEVIRRAKRHGAHVMAKALRTLESGSHVEVSIDGQLGSYFTFPTPAEIRSFRQRGYRAI